MKSKAKPEFDPKVFLTKVNGGRTISDYRSNQIIELNPRAIGSTSPYTTGWFLSTQPDKWAFAKIGY